MAMVWEIKIDDDFERFLKSAAYASNPPLTFEQLFKRWISTGLAYDFVGARGGMDGFMANMEKSAHIVNSTVRIERK